MTDLIYNGLPHRKELEGLFPTAKFEDASDDFWAVYKGEDI